MLLGEDLVVSKVDLQIKNTSSSSSTSSNNNTAAQPQDFQTTMAVHFIDVGQGLSILVQSGGQNLLYDGGDQEHASEVVSYLQQQNVQNIDYMISSHYDEDHVSGLIDCINTFPVSNVIGADYAQDSDVFTEFMDTAATKGLEVRYPFVGDSILLALEVLLSWLQTVLMPLTAIITLL